jgi:Arc/MetJ-type ribon-helix-helix transcriptional regulator
MSIDLTPEQQRVLDLAMESGAYGDPSEVLDQAFDILREQLELQGWILGDRERLAGQIEAGFRQAERGELIDGDIAIENLRRRRDQQLKPLG